MKFLDINGLQYYNTFQQQIFKNIDSSLSDIQANLNNIISDTYSVYSAYTLNDYNLQTHRIHSAVQDHIDKTPEKYITSMPTYINVGETIINDGKNIYNVVQYKFIKYIYIKSNNTQVAIYYDELNHYMFYILIIYYAKIK